MYLKNRKTYFVLMFYHKVGFAFMVMMCLSVSGKAQQDLSYAVHANIIYRFTKYIEWPAVYNTGDFIIGIIGNTPLYEELDEFVKSKAIGNRKISVRKMSASAKKYNCHILFIGDDAGKSLQKIVNITKGSPVLIVSEINAAASKGSCINFVVADERLKLEINKTNIESRDLNVASELLRLGTLVR
ncbi:MAG: YfiR family protein [Ferruginibacter sp.]